MNTGAHFPPERRVKKQADFDRVYGGDAYAADRVLVVRGARNGLSFARLGLSISRRVGNAVLRNQWKRRIREAFRTQQDQMPVGVDLVVRPRKGAEPVFADIQRSLPRLAMQVARRLEKESPA